ncbi:hypothetical protein CK203_010207 [Vitis vinifera]|uniref:Retroviral polymerase SH3-like domain-containing protein n=1 Tax=Vitis vinifera TaxID=29760 RepID=A0A438JXN9_VITVI|nr:hypothetical protein CK203_010207 [Vitis vinifera]
MPSPIMGFKTPLQALAVSISIMSTTMLPPRTFGCVVYIHLHYNQRTKLNPCARRCLFLGYATNQKGEEAVATQEGDDSTMEVFGLRISSSEEINSRVDLTIAGNFSVRPMKT